tara:strand:+ start:5242 stop:5700 length:459 start_codon:yes stop_codon:yes gene_type:complete
MKEIELIKKVGCKRRATRSLDLIANIKLENLETSHWSYPLSYGFRDALDIQYSVRVKDKKTYMVWTQGPVIAFKEGDLIKSGCKCFVVQVEFAQPMGWDIEKDKMYLGNVMFKLFKDKLGKLTIDSRYECNQLDFLALLINGKFTDLNKVML